MAQAVSIARTERREVVAGPNTYLISQFFEAPAERGLGPQGFLVEFPQARGVIRPHFHRVDQFQVVVAGSGRLGKHPVGSIALHFTDGFTPYGPIVADEAGISFYTLRAEADAGAYYMPGSRDKMERQARRGLAWEAPVAAPADPATKGGTITPHPDGLAAYTLRIPSNGQAVGPDPRGSGGQYYLIVEGSLCGDGQDLPPRSLVWVDADEAAPQVTSGDDGLVALVLQFPRRRDLSARRPRLTPSGGDPRRERQS